MRRPQPPQYSPVGRCIYCGNTDIQLSREHIVPYGLDGNLVLPKASCAECSAITGRFELTCLRGTLLGPRAFLKMQSRRIPPPEMEILVDDGKQKIPIDEAPILLVLPKYDVPTALGGPSEGADRKFGVFLKLMRLDLPEFLARHKLKGFGSPVIHNPSFCRMLAKIAHAMAVATVGIDRFKPLLLDFILRGEGFIHQFVGGSLEQFPATVDGALHEINMFEWPVHGVQYLGCEIRLFSDAGAPVYLVVVGEDLRSTA